MIDVLSQLASSKIKERTEGLNELTTLLKDRPQVIPVKALPQTAQSLLELLDAEYRAYCDLLNFYTESKKTKLRLVENRLSSVAYVLRLFTEKVSDRLKTKTLNLLLVIIPELMVKQESKTLLEPVAVHLSYALLALIKSSTFKLKFTAHQWSSIAQKICSYFEERLELSISDRTISIFLSILSELLSLDTTGIFNTSLDIHRCISKFFVFSSKETTDTRLALELSNKLIQATCLMNISQTLCLVHECWKYMVKINFSSNEAVQMEFLYFNLLACDLVDNKLPVMIGQSIHGIPRVELIATLREVILFQLENYEPNLIGSRDILFITASDTINDSSTNWFKFRDIRFNPVRDPARWLKLFSLVGLLLVYYSISQSESTNIPLFKRMKTSGNIRSILGNTDGIETLILNFLSNESDVKMRKLGLQIYTFYSSLSDVAASYIDNIFESILSAFEDDNFLEWALLALIPSMSQSGLELDDSKLAKIFKLTLPLIKSPQLCASSCAVLVQTIRYSSKLLSDLTSINQIRDICQLSEINGPFYLCEESFAFWMHIHQYSLEFLPRDSKMIETGIIQWLSGKWSQLEGKSVNPIIVGSFISWLCGIPSGGKKNFFMKGQVVLSSCPEFTLWKEKWDNWNALEDQRLFLLQPKMYKKTVKHPGEHYMSTQAVYQPDNLNPLLYRILDKIESDSVSDDASRLTWIFLGLSIVESLKNNENLRDLASDFNVSLESSLSKIKLDETSKVRVFLNALRSLDYSSNNRRSLRMFPLSQVMEFLKILCNGHNLGDLTDENFGDSSSISSKGQFGMVSRSRYHDIPSRLVISSLCETLVGILFAESADSELDYSLTLFVDLISGLEGGLLCLCLEKFNCYMSKKELTPNKDINSILENITQIIGEKLLDSRRNTSNRSMTILASYLRVTKDQWMCFPDSLLSADCNDILDWVLGRLKDSSFSGIMPLVSITQLLLAVLMSSESPPVCAGKTKQELFSCYKFCVAQLNPANVSLVAPSTAKYMETISFKNEKIMFMELVNTFETPQKSLESSAFYSMTLADVSGVSYATLVASIRDMLGYLRYGHTKFYVLQALERIKTQKRLTSLHELFDICKFDILNYWFSQPSGELYSLIDLFGFEDIASFFEKYSMELGAFYFATGSNNELVSRSLHSLGLESECDILKKSYPMAIPLAFVGENIGDLIFEVTTQLLQKSMKSYSKRAKFVTIRWIIKFMDFGCTTDLKEYLASCEGLRQHSTWKYLIDDSKHYIRYRFPLNIPFQVGRRVLESSFMLHNLISELGLLKLLLLWELSDLEEAKSDTERIKCIRELKFTLLCFRDKLLNSTVISEFCSRISTYLDVPKVHNEVADIVTLLLQAGFAEKVVLTDSFAPILFYCITFVKKTGHKLKPGLLNALLLMKEWPDSRTPNFWQYCVDYLQELGVSSDIYELDEILEDGNCSKIVLSLFSLLIRDIDPPDRPFRDSALSEQQIKNLLRYSVDTEYVSDNFQLWKAHIIRFYHLDHDVGGLSVEHHHSWIEISEDVARSKYSLGLLHVSFFRFLSSNMLTCNSKARFLLEVVLQHIISIQHSSDIPEELLPLELRQYYQVFAADKTLVDDAVFEMIFGSTHRLVETSENSNGWFSRASLAYSDWLLELLVFLANTAQSCIPHIKYFIHVCRSFISFTEDILPYIVSILLIHNPDVSANIFPWFFSEAEKLAQTSDFEKKIAVTLKILLIIRYNARLDQKCCKNIYPQLDLKLLSELALKANAVRVSYLLYEEYYMDIDADSDVPLLRNIYCGIGDTDFLSGLPPASSLSEVQARIDEIEPDSWKRFMFYNAKLDSQFHQYETEPSATFGRALESNGFYGLASLLEGGSSQFLSDGPYRCALHLDQWELPTPTIIDSEEKALYRTLRRVRYGNGSISAALKEELLSIMSSRPKFSQTNKWIDTVSEIETMRLMANYFSPEYIPHILKESLALAQRRMRSIDFADYKSILQSHYLFFNSIIQNPRAELSADPTLPYLAALFNIKTYIEFAINSKSPQDALRSAFLLESLVDSIRKRGIFENFEGMCQRVVSFLSARALWNSSTKTAIMMMQKLTEEDEYMKTLADLATPTAHNFTGMLDVPADEARSYLVEWLSKSKFETPSVIYNRYINNRAVTVESPEIRASVFYTFGNFLNRQLRNLQQDGEIEERQARYDTGIKERKSLKLIYHNKKLPQDERKDAKRHLSKVEAQLLRDKNVLDNLLGQRACFLKDALLSYLNVLVLSNNYNSDVIDKFCGLWFEFDKDDNANRLLLKEISSIPTWKFLPWVHQIASKLSLEESEFQKPLKLTIKRLLYKLPYDSLYSVLNIKLYTRYPINANMSIARKVSAVEKLLEDMKSYDHGDYFREYVMPIENFCTMSIDLAALKPEAHIKKLSVEGIPNSKYWLKQIIGQKIPFPTAEIKIQSSAEGRLPRPHISMVDPTIEITTTGISLPKVVKFTLSDGTTRKLLLKCGNDDLRQDAIMEQVFTQVNNIIQEDKGLHSHGLKIRTYKVIPLGPKAGIIEFVANSTSLFQILSGLHQKDSIGFDQARRLMRSAQTKSVEERLATYLKITGEIKPQLRNFFFDSFPDYDDWFIAKKTYTKGIATTSIVGYILGLGDRHLNNILLDFRTGEPIHIDLGIAFDQGRLLPIPELVPFRLTRDIVDGFGVTKVDGLFRKNCERVYDLLRKESERVMCVLNILKWDPLYSWLMSPITRHKYLLEEDTDSVSGVSSNAELYDVGDTDQNNEAYRALRGVEEKLRGSGLSVEAKVQELIQEATSPENLAVIYMGWSPFY